MKFNVTIKNRDRHDIQYLMCFSELLEYDEGNESNPIISEEHIVAFDFLVLSLCIAMQTQTVSEYLSIKKEKQKELFDLLGKVTDKIDELRNA